MSDGRVFFGPADTEIVGLAADGTPITASLDAGAGPMLEITQYVTDVRLIARGGS